MGFREDSKVSDSKKSGQAPEWAAQMVAESPFLEAFKKHSGTELRDVV